MPEEEMRPAFSRSCSGEATRIGKLKRLYLSIWDRNPEEDDTFEYCADYFETLKTFIEKAAGRNVGLVVYLT